MNSKHSHTSQITSHTLLLKIWLEHGRGFPGQTWRFSLEDANSGNRRGFTDLDSLIIYLQALVLPQPKAAEDTRKRP